MCNVRTREPPLKPTTSGGETAEFKGLGFKRERPLETTRFAPGWPDLCLFHAPVRTLVAASLAALASSQVGGALPPHSLPTRCPLARLGLARGTQAAFRGGAAPRTFAE